MISDSQRDGAKRRNGTTLPKQPCPQFWQEKMNKGTHKGVQK